MPTTTLTPADFLKLCDDRGVVIERVQGGLVTLIKRFTPGSAAEYAQAETDTSILHDTPSAGTGSTWGTTGDGVGGYAAVQAGCMRLNKSNVHKVWVRALSKLLEERWELARIRG